MVNLLANDSDVEMASPYEEDTIAFTGVWGAGHGSIVYDSGTIYYTPDANFCGVETFSYSVVDSHGAESVVQSEIWVEPVNDFPVVQYDYGEAEDSVWNYYSIGNLVGNDFDVDGDSLTIINPRILEGGADVQISGGDLMVKPDFHEDRVVVGYTVSDGHGGEVDSELRIDSIREHNFAPQFSGLYAIGWKNNFTVWFNFHAYDLNGGNTWGDSGDIIAISASAPSVGTITDEPGYTFKFKGDVENASVVLTAVDQAGATGSIYINIGNLAKGDGNYFYSPVVLDLDGDGVELLDISAGVAFDWNLDGIAESTGWVGKDDGFLVYDYDHDRLVRYANELALKEYDPQANTDLEGLRAFDSNKDGIFDEVDDEWQAFGVWQDKNSDGKTDEGEFADLDELGICSLDLQSDGNVCEHDSNIVFGTTTYERTDGSTGALADVGLGGERLVFTEVKTPENLNAAEEDPLCPSSEQIVALSPAGGDADLPFDDAEIERQYLQLLTDIAGCPDAEPIEPFPTAIDPVVAEYHAAPVFAGDEDIMVIV
jgi:hypothetical protein